MGCKLAILARPSPALDSTEKLDRLLVPPLCLPGSMYTSAKTSDVQGPDFITAGHIRLLVL